MKKICLTTFFLVLFCLLSSYGQHNEVIISQTGSDHKAFVYQTGSENEAEIEQTYDLKVQD